MTHLTFRTSEQAAAQLTELAQEHGVSRSRLLRDLADPAKAQRADRVALPDRRELLELLAERARSGNVQAIRLLLLEPWEHSEDEPADPFDALDELSQRREARSG